jgi:YD repeat-containing protein
LGGQGLDTVFVPSKKNFELYGGYNEVAGLSAEACVTKSVSSIEESTGFEPVGSKTNFHYDDCGNVVEMQSSEPFMKPDNSISQYTTKMNMIYDQLYKASMVQLNIVPAGGEDQSAPTATLKANQILGYGFITESQDEIGLVTKYNYDDLGRISEIFLPGSTVPDVTYIYEEYFSSYFGHQALRVKETTKLSENREVQTYYIYDGYGRLVQTQISDGNRVIVDKKDYDSLNRIRREFKPVEYIFEINPSIIFGQFIPVAGEYVMYEYDAANRIKSIKNYDDTYVYNDNGFYYENGNYNSNTSAKDEMGTVRTYYNDIRGNLAGIDVPEGVLI